MSRTLCGLLLALTLGCGAMAWGMALADEWHLLYGVVPVIGTAIVLVAFARLREGGRMPAYAGASRLLVYALVVGAIVHVALFSPFHPARAFLVLHVAMAFATLTLLLRGQGAEPRPAMPLIGEVLLVSTLLLIVVCELTLRLWASYAPGPLFLQRDMTPVARITAVRFTPGTVIDGVTVNEDGFRDATFEHREGTATVMVLGDRQFALGVAAAACPTSVANARIPNVSFWNATLPHTGPLEAEHLFDVLGSSTRPDAIVHVIALDDDLLDLRRTPSPWTSLALWLDPENALLTCVGRRVLERMAGSNRLSPPTATPPSETPDDPTAEVPRHSDAWLADRARSTAANLQGEQGHALAQQAIDITARMSARAAERGIAFGVIILPARYQLDADLWAAVHSAMPSADRDAPRSELVHDLRAHSIPVLDLTTVLATAQPWTDGRAHLFHNGDTALNTRGSKLAGEALAEFGKTLLANRPPERR